MPKEQDVRHLQARLTAFTGARLPKILGDWTGSKSKSGAHTCRPTDNAAGRRARAWGPAKNRRLFPVTLQDESGSANHSVTQRLDKEWVGAREKERQNRREQQVRQGGATTPAKGASHNKVVQAVQQDDESAGEFEVVTDHRGALGVVWIRVVKGCDPADLLRELKLVLRYSNVAQMWGQLQQLCDKHNSGQAIHVVADQDTIHAALQGMPLKWLPCMTAAVTGVSTCCNRTVTRIACRGGTMCTTHSGHSRLLCVSSQ